ncbi:hypothetical protein LOK49_LG02G03200 [Camellia lanceoleosa]|uniref:Uncharacterized protein n=1 Tax=Camellia lanceoleosa TaxID=1840588 RepID=A0ACC0IKX1_9ERIC|nr:hypothetical protein LOK49_LG02G03200 [Camellia lanceoleosa]
MTDAEHFKSYFSKVLCRLWTKLQDGIVCANAEGGLGQAADISRYGYQELTTPWNSYIHYLNGWNLA